MDRSTTDCSLKALQVLVFSLDSFMRSNLVATRQNTVVPGRNLKMEAESTYVPARRNSVDTRIHTHTVDAAMLVVLGALLHTAYYTTKMRINSHRQRRSTIYRTSRLQNCYNAIDRYMHPI
jgi:hypothetical protein